MYQHNFSNNNKLFAEKTVEQGLLSVRLLEARLLVLRGETAGARAVGVVERSSVFVEGGEIEEVRLAADRTTDARTVVSNILTGINCDLIREFT